MFTSNPFDSKEKRVFNRSKITFDEADIVFVADFD